VRPAAGGLVVRRSSLLLHAGLLLATFLTTTATGALQMHGDRSGPWWSLGLPIVPIADGLSYSVPLLAILLCHELGHYLVARLYGVDASLPYFIPLPPGIGFGTLGAVIGMRQVTSDRKKLIDIGAAGPLAGLLVAIPVLLYGLMHSPVATIPSGGMQEGNSILYAVLKHIAKGAWLPDGSQDVSPNPTAWAGWVGLLVTMINLLPIGQLDGGHIATAYFGNRYNRIAERLQRLLPLGAVLVLGWVFHVVHAEAGALHAAWDRRTGVAIAASAALPWLVWYALASIVRRASGGINHPPVDDRPLPRSRRGLFWLTVIVFVAIFTPVPLRPIYRAPGADAPPAEPATQAALP
jgi:membrane-associated protease RseP (regulator of RpoE activity)